ncbi:hypothetical protein B0H13DRAFT_2377332 [Mycena leptocephala]|nr:hypothetical protein B0H13DRAFT_2377332 [Mycena leptocephala]
MFDGCPGAIWDGEASDYELESVETVHYPHHRLRHLDHGHGPGSLWTIELSCQHYLDLSWMNNTNTFIYFLVYVQYKSQPEAKQIKARSVFLDKASQGEQKPSSPKPGELQTTDTTTPSIAFWTVTFGQILAMILLVLSLRDLVETMFARREKHRKDELARLEKERQAKLARSEKQRKDQLTVHLQHAIRETAKMETLRESITNGADISVELAGAQQHLF